MTHCVADREEITTVVPVTVLSKIDADCDRMVYESKKQLEVAVRMDSVGEGRPLRCEHSVYV